MKTFSFLANRAKKFASDYFYEACDFVVGRKASICIQRYLVYPTYFSWLLEQASSQDTMYITHIGEFSDWRQGSVMRDYLEEQRRVVRAKKLKVIRLVVFKEEDSDLGVVPISQILYNMTESDMEIYLSSTELISEFTMLNDESLVRLNWAIYERDGKSILLKYDIIYNPKPPRKQNVTVLSFEQNEIQSKINHFNKIVKSETCKLVEKTKEEEAITYIFAKSGWSIHN